MSSDRFDWTRGGHELSYAEKGEYRENKNQTIYKTFCIYSICSEYYTHFCY